MTSVNIPAIERFRHWRENTGLTNEQLTRVTGIDAATLRRFELGQSSRLSSKHIRRLIETYFEFPTRPHRPFFLWDRFFGSDLAQRRKAIRLLQSELAKRAG